MIIKRKTRKAIRKSVNKVMKKHGAKIAAGLAGSIASALATLASTDAAGSKGRKSNLAALSGKIADAATGTGGKSRKRGKADREGHRREKKRLAKAEQTEELM